MADIVNLRQARKHKARAEKEATAEANRLKFGRGKGEKTLAEARANQAERTLDAIGSTSQRTEATGAQSREIVTALLRVRRSTRRPSGNCRARP